MRFRVAGVVWNIDEIQRDFEEIQYFNVTNPQKPFDELKTYLTKKFYLDKSCRARLLLDCRELEVSDWFWYGASYDLPAGAIIEFKKIVFETSLPAEGFKYLLVVFPWLSNSDLAFNYAVAFPPLSTAAMQVIWGWKRNHQGDLLLNERLLQLMDVERR